MKNTKQINPITTTKGFPPQTMDEKLEVLKDKINEIVKRVNKLGGKK